MKYFKKFLEHVDDVYPSNYGQKDNSDFITAQNDIVTSIKECEIFLFQSDDKHVSEYNETLNNDLTDIKALPFRVCWFEERSAAISVIQDEGHQWIVYGIFVGESEDGNYNFGSLFVYNPKRDLYENIVFHYLRDGKNTDEFNNNTIDLINRYIERIHTGKEAVEPCKLKCRIGGKKNKAHRRIGRIIHIGSKSLKSEPNPISSKKKIEWSHSWLVRGHWRKIKGIGKNREGEYCVDGYTFVNPFKKGEGDLVKKLRIVD